MLPPTSSTLRDLCGFGTAGQAVRAAAGRPLKPIMATVRQRADGAWHLEWEL
ncbi:hypothetical protein ACFQ9X_54870 [Catenulispora yoronensis]